MRIPVGSFSMVGDDQFQSTIPVGSSSGRRIRPGRARGELENQISFSRRAFASELCRRPSKQTKAARDLRQTARVVGPVAITITRG
jgi:hypothetical protein